ncbi:MAG TPA: glycosyltransferase family 9 protein [Phycisphaerae bacterium]|nr:glycosyltransferase family 9 protein [Phycisphaerae bacterium]
MSRILIIKPSALGDVATTLPLLCDLKRAMPGAEIDWLIHPLYAPVIAGHDALHEWIGFDRKGLGAWWYKPSATRRFTGLLKTLREKKYDIVIDAQGLLRSGFLAKVTRAKMRIGFADAREGGSLFYTHKVKIRRREAPAVVRMRALLEPLGIPHGGAAEYRVPLQGEAVAKVHELVPDGEAKGLIGFLPGCRGEGKRWAAEGFARVIAEVAEGHSVVLLGSPDERELCAEIARKSAGKGVINLAGRTSVAEMIAMLDRCRLVVGNDTGPLHVAVALGRRVLGLYGKTDPKSVGPYGQMENVVRFRPGEAWEETSREVVARVGKMMSAGGAGATTR